MTDRTGPAPVRWRISALGLRDVGPVVFFGCRSRLIIQWSSQSVVKPINVPTRPRAQPSRLRPDMEKRIDVQRRSLAGRGLVRRSLVRRGSERRSATRDERRPARARRWWGAQAACVRQDQAGELVPRAAAGRSREFPFQGHCFGVTVADHRFGSPLQITHGFAWRANLFDEPLRSRPTWLVSHGLLLCSDPGL